MEEKGLLQRNPTRGVDLPSQQVLAPRELSEDQRYTLHSLVEQEGDRRRTAIFALGYWAGCRVSDELALNFVFLCKEGRLVHSFNAINWTGSLFARFQ
jgi:site-specific recombinase XerC